MNAFVFLNELKKINAMIKNKEIEIEQWRSIATSSAVHSDRERVQTSGSKQKMADAVVKVVDMVTEVEIEKNKLIQKQREIIRVIEQLPVEQYTVLHLKYVQNFTLKMAAYEQGISYSTVKKFHKEGIRNVQKMLDGGEVHD